MSLMNFLRDPIWQFIGVLWAIIAILVTILITSIQRSRKALSCETISDTPLLSLEKEDRPRVQVLFDNKPVDNVRFIVLKLRNSGNIPILPNDYIEPIKVEFEQDAEVLDTSVIETIPSNIKTSLVKNLNNIVLEPTLLNRKDTIYIKILLIKSEIAPIIHARIIGVTAINSERAIGAVGKWFRAFIL